ncbi:hypothetical protein [Polaromonas sp. JS666]|uniref:hypothetical protein n=1 Tax=Polaromonas sp. (strain JS666 / ATCC BAA-500) TaxID=296591 RepID=UPI0012ED0571|nr:hypothetical protein [Polaromonas sp. JS666]
MDFSSLTAGWGDKPFEVCALLSSRGSNSPCASAIPPNEQAASARKVRLIKTEKDDDERINLLNS